MTVNFRHFRLQNLFHSMFMGGVCVATILSGSSAKADGTFFQLDVASSTTGAAFSSGRGAFTFGASAVSYDSGQSYGLSTTYELPLDGRIATFKIGPSLGFVRDNRDDYDLQVGVKVVAERYIPTDFGSLFLLADLNSIERSWFALAQLGFAKPSIAVEVSHGESKTYSETSIALSKPINNSPVSLRFGYRFESKEMFAGVAINTF